MVSLDKRIQIALFLFHKNQFNLLISVFEQHLLNGRHVCSWMLNLCMKTLQCATKQCATKVLLFCFEVKSNSNFILKRDIMHYGNAEAVEAAAYW